MLEISFLDAGLDDPGWPASHEGVLARLAEARRRGTRATLTEADILQWDWASQTVALTPAATTRLRAALPADEDLTPSVRQMKAMHEKLGWGNPIGLALHTRGFLVSLADQPLLGGVVLEAVSERPVTVPVIRVSLREGAARFHLLPVHFPFLLADPGARNPLPGDVTPEAAGDAGIAELMYRRANGPEAERLRAVIRPATLREALRRAGLLAPDRGG